MFRNDNSGISLDVPKKENIFKRCVFNSASELKRSLSEMLHGDSRKKNSNKIQRITDLFC